MARSIKVAVLPGDGIGPEVTEEAVKVLKATGIKFEFIKCSVGGRAYLEKGNPLPSEAMEACDEADAVLFGAVGHDYAPYGVPRKVLVYLRMEKNAYVNVRPLKLYPGVPRLQNDPSYPEVDLVIIRDNSEGMTLEHEGYLIDERGLDKRVITYSGAQRIIAFAINYAMKHGRKKVTCIDKSTWLYSDKIFRSAFERLAERQKEIDTEYMTVDMAAMTQVQRPGHFDVIVTPDIYGDVLSGIAIAQIGGVGMAPSACIGDKFAYFEPIHGTAWDMVGKGVANPIASILSAKLMLEWLKREDEARRIEATVRHVLQEGKVLTPDLGGNSSTSEVGDAIASLVAGESPYQDTELKTVQTPR
ncbi:MAG: isocitrate/isopropylmalate dehydrogenase family protein [Candidatus Bathyarchaeota archaeon]|jgi:isocitrate/isopropylmalate dehydrogenase|nr:isocitrate/isopropylmalate dehydrogenase family protein [Candidatus Bathyarchaeota archaeon]